MTKNELPPSKVRGKQGVFDKINKFVHAGRLQEGTRSFLQY